MSAITTKFVTDHQLTNEMSIEELSQYVPEMRNLLEDDREKRHQARNHLQKGQVPVLKELELEAEDNLSERDVKAISRTLVETASDSVVALSRLSRLRRELRILNAPEKIISATKILEITRASNKIQQKHTEALKDPEKLRLTYLRAMFASVVHGPKNLSKANTYASEALHHSPDNHTSSSDRYTIVNFKRRRLNKQNAKVYTMLSSENRTLKKQLEDYHFQYNTLEKRIKRLEKDVKFLETEYLDECVDMETVINLIQEIVSSIIGKKGSRDALYKGFSYLSESSEETDSVKTIVIRENEAIPYKQQRKA
ncbi:hypothetical protein C1645_811694 [Glomus cerebriforme]|uniref:Uncharacterized protein n=1 Tax=Glomus cerebriforme TaxID=658196 RepID=A0A397TVM5_9GLOM|nr:hypothetical protein C1645_811694 [Glomus cerebriforme]